jgi:hypothetical protein
LSGRLGSRRTKEKGRSREGAAFFVRYPVTPDGRYFVAKGLLWRCTDPSLPEAERERLVRALMAARRAVRDAEDDSRLKAARARVQEAKVGLGERGPPWWGEGETYDRMAPRNTPYAAWYEELLRRGAFIRP